MMGNQPNLVVTKGFFGLHVKGGGKVDHVGVSTA